jgi:hypothetical protein
MDDQSRSGSTKGPESMFVGDAYFDVIATGDSASDESETTWGEPLADAEYR